MKKKIGTILVLSMMFLSGCGKEKKDDKMYYDNSGNIIVNVVSEAAPCFDMVFFTEETINNVEVSKVIGDGINDDTFQVSVMNNTADIYRNHKYKNLYCSDWMFDFKTDENYTEYKITGMELKINGEVRRINFGTPLEYINGEGYDVLSKELRAVFFANEFPSSAINSGDFFTYNFIADKKMTIEEVYVGGDLKAEVRLFLNDDMTKEYSFPVEVDEGTMVNMFISYKSDVLDIFSYVLTNLYVTYSVDGQKNTCKGVVAFSPTSPVDEELKKIDSLIDYIISK